MKAKILAAAVLLILCGSAVYSQSSEQQKAKAAAQTFYKKYLPMFGYPSESDLGKLRPHLSRNLSALIANERRRMRLWTAKNKDEKPPVIDDLFLCNHEEPATSFRVGEAVVTNKVAVVTTSFDYAEKGKVYATCQTKSSFIDENGKWLLDNIAFDEGVDLKTLLSREKYDELPD